MNDSLEIFDSSRFSTNEDWQKWCLDVVKDFLGDSLDFDPDSLDLSMNNIEIWKEAT